MKSIDSVLFSLSLIMGLSFVCPVQAELKPEVKIHGELEYEYSDSTAKDMESQFQVDKFVIQPKVKYGDYLKLSAQWYCRPKGNAYLNEFHAKFLGLPLGTWFDAGLYERAIKDHHSRKTETYSLYGNAFYRDDTYGISWGNWKKKHKAPEFYWIVSLAEGYKIGHKQPAEQTSEYDGTNSDKIIQDDRDDKNNLFYPEVGLNLGTNLKFGETKIDVMGFYYTDKLKSSERSKLEEYLSDAQKSKMKEGNDRNRVGGQVNAKIRNCRLFAGFLTADDSGLSRTAYVFEALNKIKLGDRETFIDFHKRGDEFSVIRELVEEDD